MLDEKEVVLMETLKEHLAGYLKQRDQAQINLNQLVGAIFACNSLIAQYEQALKKEPEETSENEQVNKQTAK